MIIYSNKGCNPHRLDGPNYIVINHHIVSSNLGDLGIHVKNMNIQSPGLMQLSRLRRLPDPSSFKTRVTNSIELAKSCFGIEKV